MKIYALILAGGEGKRAGGDKLSKVIKEKPMLEWVIENTKKAKFTDIILISGKEVEFCNLMARKHNIIHVYNEEWHLGMGYTLKKGIENLPKDIDGFAIVLGDMPFIKPETMNLLIEEFFNYKDIVVPVFNGRKGHPPIFPLKYAEEMKKVCKDIGAREIIKKYQNRVRLVETNDVGILLDIDTLSELSEIEV
ncbi:nucleotidyltransferase family protein [Caldanaerobacter subterraneus]|uniref:Nucleotidyltransferase family protein n=1 Tax=Caldanaerobacter subterraneus TaxID=911092 RepID=A0A7Y2L510_9THEO|nr:nucleotidyltransferase family protein [Caldanaerobacter subterraneus]NNG65913.1 nucleotidyltransferase family protein [Caldanaerobacter subterraneus]